MDKTYLGGGEIFFDCGGGERPRLVPSTGLQTTITVKMQKILIKNLD